MRPRVHCGPRGWWAAGGILTYAADRLQEEIAYVAYHFHWPLGDILDLEHADRQRYAAEIAKINTRMNQASHRPASFQPYPG
ncbi:DUF6760 family protein [Longispora albida]|uniref:DUF6760 family protein n=1 Tax=Longispora albida TaxID=203523 RepID=UPI00037B0E0A|nr:DUF6760 family protein [Longispora albida]